MDLFPKSRPMTSDGRSRSLLSREYTLAANRLNRPPPWHSGGKRWAVSASSVAMAEREARLVSNSTAGCPPTFWSLQRSYPAKPGDVRRGKTDRSPTYAERIRFKPDPYRVEPCQQCDSLRECLNNEFRYNFNTEQLKHVETATRNTLPTQQTISDERRAIQGERSHSASIFDLKKNKKKKTVQFYSAPNSSKGDRLQPTSTEVVPSHGGAGCDAETTEAMHEVNRDVT